jgi:hypothetical protein
MIRTAEIQDLDAVYKIMGRARRHMDEQGIFQWDDIYPGKSLLTRDIKAEYSHAA